MARAVLNIRAELDGQGWNEREGEGVGKGGDVVAMMDAPAAVADVANSTSSRPLSPTDVFQPWSGRVILDRAPYSSLASFLTVAPFEWGTCAVRTVCLILVRQLSS